MRNITGERRVFLKLPPSCEAFVDQMPHNRILAGKMSIKLTVL